VDGLIIDVNKAIPEMMGYERSEMMGKNVLDFFPPEYQERIREVIKLRGTEPYEAPLVRKDGTILIAQINGRYIDYKGQNARVATIHDVTEQVQSRKRIEEFARSAEEEGRRLRTILDTLSVGIAIIDSAGHLLEVNEHADALVGSIWPKTIDSGDHSLPDAWWADTGMPLKEDCCPVRRAMKGEISIGELIDVQRQDGSRRTILYSAAPLRNSLGEVTSVVAVTQDVTRQCKLEHEARDAKEKAEIYIDLLAHDICNLHTAAIGYLELATERLELEAREQRFILRSLEAMETSSDLIKRVRKIHRMEMYRMKRELVDLGSMLKEVKDMYGDIPEREVILNYTLVSNRFILANELLRDVFSNIIDNAIDHSSGAVNIDIELTSVYERGGEYHKVTISDTGPGIPNDMKMGIFSRLERGLNRAVGTGFGLYLVRCMVEDLNGRVWVEDRVLGDHTKGAKFIVMLPSASSG
jgi:PAS domain S-box-containing protein